jgi:hypothetical protein
LIIFNFEKDLSPDATETGSVSNILSAIAVFGNVEIKSLVKIYCNRVNGFFLFQTWHNFLYISSFI